MPSGGLLGPRRRLPPGPGRPLAILRITMRNRWRSPAGVPGDVRGEPWRDKRLVLLRGRGPGDVPVVPRSRSGRQPQPHSKPGRRHLAVPVPGISFRREPRPACFQELRTWGANRLAVAVIHTRPLIVTGVASPLPPHHLRQTRDQQRTVRLARFLSVPLAHVLPNPADHRTGTMPPRPGWRSVRIGLEARPGYQRVVIANLMPAASPRDPVST
jgi:hypothetical protein